MSARAAASLWTDSHCHLQDDYLEAEELDAVLERAYEAGVDRLVCVGTNQATSIRAVDLVSRPASGSVPAPEMWATVGLHPHEAVAGTGPIAELLAERCPVSPATALRARPSGSIVGVGECGLDYFYEHSPREEQRKAFAEQIELAKRFALTLVVHTRDAWDDTFAILEEHAALPATIIHCFTGGPTEAQRCLELGTYLSFSGIATFKNASEVREAATLCPADRLLVETDSPFLAPVPHRGRQNEPSFVAVVGEALARLRGVSSEELARTSSEAAARAFALA